MIPTYLTPSNIAQDKKKILFELISSYFDEIDPLCIRQYDGMTNGFGEYNFIAPLCYGYYDGNDYSIIDAVESMTSIRLENKVIDDVRTIIEFVLNNEVSITTKNFFSCTMKNYIKEFLDGETEDFVECVANNTVPEYDALIKIIDHETTNKVLFIKNSLLGNASLYLNEI